MSEEFQMTEDSLPPLTPLTPKADRSNHEVRLFEEAILRLRGHWPATATGLCTDVNREFRFGLGARAGREQIIERRLGETLRLVEALYGPETVEEVRRSAASHGRDPGSGSVAGGYKRRHRLRAA
jgi:hypothetical protein